MLKLKRWFFTRCINPFDVIAMTTLPPLIGALGKLLGLPWIITLILTLVAAIWALVLSIRTERELER